MSSFDINHIRGLFPEVERKLGKNTLTYLDNAASTLKHQKVIDALNKHYSQDAANIHRGVHTLSESGTREYEETRDVIKEFINAPEREEIIFTKGTTESINLIAESYGSIALKPGDKVLLSTMEHHSNIVPWQLIAKKTKAKVVEIPVDDNGQIIESEYQKLLDKDVKIVSMAHISNALGTINDVKKYIAMAHEVGAKFVVDAAQSIAHQKIDVQDLDCDFLAFSAHKIYGPTGVGILYGKKELLETMPPYQGGGDMIDTVTFEETTFNELPHKFEAGTPHIAGVIALKESFHFLNEVGLDNIKKYESALLKEATEKLSSIKGLKIIGPQNLNDKSAVISFTIEGAHPHDLGTLLDQQGIAIRTGHHCTQPLMARMNLTSTARASFSLYNNTEEIDRLYYGLIKACELL